MEAALWAILANLAHFILFPPEGGAIVLPMGHRGEPWAERPPLPGMGKTLPGLISTLEAVGMLERRSPSITGHATTIKPTGAFADEVRSRGVSGADFGRRRGLLDCVRLTRKDSEGKKTNVRLPAGEAVAAVRSEVECFNKWLEACDIRYVGNDPVDTRERRLTRHFSLPRHVDTLSLDYGGRLFGGFWQQIPKERRTHIRINGEPIAEVDFGQMFPRLAYAQVGQEPPSGDLYALPGAEGLSGDQRGVIKKAFNALLFKYGTLRRLPSEITDGLPYGWTAGRIKRAITSRHPAIAHLLNVGTGYRLMHTESVIACAVVRRCMEEGMTVLPLHDAMLTAVSNAPQVKSIMEEAGREISGQHLSTSIKHLG